MRENEMKARGLIGAAAVVAVLALLVLVPSSPMLTTDPSGQLFSLVSPAGLASVAEGELDPSWDVIGLPVTVYAVFSAGSYALAMGLTALLGWRRGERLMRGVALALVCGVCAFLCARVVYCAARWGSIVNEMSGDEGIDETTGFGVLLGGWLRFLVQPWRGGYSMYGAVFGGLAGAAIYARCRRQSFAETADLIVPGMLLMIAAGRAAEHFTLQGMSRWSASDALNMLPFYSETEGALAVYAYEALAAAAALIVCLVLLGLRAPAGRAAENGIAIVSVLQIVLDAWREDEYLRFGFVRLNMILAAVAVAFVLTMRIIRCVKLGQGWTCARWWTILRVVLFLAAVAAVIITEFGMDGKFGITAEYVVLYAIQVAAVVVMGASVLMGDGREVKTVA